MIAVLIALAGCGVAHPWPDIPPAPGTQKVLLLGDELLAEAAPKVGPALAFFGMQAQVIDRTVPGAGLLDPGIMDSLKAQLDANADADIVVVEFLGDCSGCVVQPGSADYFHDWIAAAQQLIDAIRGRGMTPVWVVAPPIDPAIPTAAMLQTLSADGLEFARADQLVVANWADAFTDLYGDYLPFLFYSNVFEEPAWHVVRDNGVDFADDGILRAANWTAAAIRQAWELPTTLEVSTSPSLFPAFSASITDYVTRCTGDPVSVTIGAPDGTTVSVAGQPAASGRFSSPVNLSTGQEFTIVVQPVLQAPTDYFVRCLPLDFPGWTASRTGTTQAEYYITAPITSDPAGTYPAIFDSDGVPVWWGPKTATLFAELLPDRNLAWTKSDGTPADERSLDGTLISSVTTSTGSQNQHDLLRLANGDYVTVADVLRANVDFSSWGPSGPGTATLVDHVIEELTPAGGVVWSWDTADHISVAQTDPQWRNATFLGAYDAYHWNSIEATNTGFMVSFRHLDAVYTIDKTTGDITWKLGGSTTPQSLSIQNDPVFTDGSHFGGQHDARLLSDGTVTLFDDGTGLDRAPRAVRYQIDTGSQTATMLEQQTDPIAPSSGFGGSARRLDGGDWVVGWGGTNSVSEITNTGSRVFLMQFVGGTIYRAVPVPSGVLDRAALRAGMDAQYP